MARTVTRNSRSKQRRTQAQRRSQVQRRSRRQSQPMPLGVKIEDALELRSLGD